MNVSPKTVVKLHYKGLLYNGTVFDSTEGRHPLSFVCGSGNIIPGLEEEIFGLGVGDKKTFIISADRAYGPRQQEAIQEVSKTHLPKGTELKIGMKLAAQGSQGIIPVVISDIRDKTILIDFNHPLAGKDLTFIVEIVDVRNATTEELESGKPLETFDQ